MWWYIFSEAVSSKFRICQLKVYNIKLVSWNFFWNGHFWIFPTIFGGLNTPPHYQITKIVMNLVCKSTHRQFYKKHFGTKRARVWGTMKIKDRYKLVFQKDKKIAIAWPCVDIISSDFGFDAKFSYHLVVDTFKNN